MLRSPIPRHFSLCWSCLKNTSTFKFISHYRMDSGYSPNTPTLFCFFHLSLGSVHHCHTALLQISCLFFICPSIFASFLPWVCGALGQWEAHRVGMAAWQKLTRLPRCPLQWPTEKMGIVYLLYSFFCLFNIFFQILGLSVSFFF